MRLRRPVDEVWIVQHDESPHNTVIGVFRSSQEAQAYADEVQGNYPNGVILQPFPIGYRQPPGVPYTRAE